MSGCDKAVDFWGRVDVREGAADEPGDSGEARGSLNAREWRTEAGCRPLSSATKDAVDEEDWFLA